MGKRGITNVEMIVAVTIFVFAIVLVVYYITFVGFRQEPSEVFLTTLEKSLRNKTEITYNITYLSIAGSGPGDCFKIQRHSDISEDENKVLLIKDNNNVPFNINKNNLLIRNPGLFSIYSFSVDIISPNHINCDDPVELTKGQGYNYSITYQDRVFVLDKLFALDYKNFKEKYKLQKDFAINITYYDAINKQFVSVFYLAAPTKALEVPIKAKQIPIKYTKDEEIHDAFLNMQVW